MINEPTLTRETLIPEPNLLDVVTWLYANALQGLNIASRNDPNNPVPARVKADLPDWKYRERLLKTICDALVYGTYPALSGEERIWFKYLNRYAALYGQFGNAGFDDPDAIALYRQAASRRDELLAQLRAAQQSKFPRKGRG